MARLFIKSPLAVHAPGAKGGIVVEDGRIAELVPSGGQPRAPVDETFDASRHVVLPGLVNTHHHFYQTLTRVHPQAVDKELFPWLQALYPIWARLGPDSFRLSVRLALTELLLSGCTTRPTTTISSRKAWGTRSTWKPRRLGPWASE